jgi:hypothetical protein
MVNGIKMKAILIKTPEQLYKLKFYNNEDMVSCATGLLSKQNCDSLFGVFDVEKLAEKEVFQEYYDWGGEVFSEDYLISKRLHFIEGFKKAMELNKDKLFTLEDMRKTYEEGYLDEHSFEVVIQSLQQPTEINVEIVTTTRMENGKSGIDTPTIKPKIDSEGCLVLRKL